MKKNVVICLLHITRSVWVCHYTCCRQLTPFSQFFLLFLIIFSSSSFFWFARQTLILSCFVSHSSFVSCINDTYLSIFVYTDIYTKVATFLFIFLFTPVHRLFWLFYFRCAPETHSYMSQNEKFCWSPNINIIMLHFFISK